MTVKYITSGETAFTLKGLVPTGYPVDGTYTVTIQDPNSGTELVSSGSVTKYAGDTLASAAVAGAQDVVLTTGTALQDGDVIAIGSDAEGWQVREVAKYVASTKTATLRTRLSESVSTGAGVQGLDLSVVVDASGWASTLDKVVVYWETDGYPNHKELVEVRVDRGAIGALENEFRAAYQDLYNEFDPQNFELFEDRARQRLKSEFSAKGRSFDLLVDMNMAKELWLTEIALLVARSTGASTEYYERIQTDREYQMQLIDGLSLWIDDNEDGVVDTDEEQPALPRNFARGMF